MSINLCGFVFGGGIIMKEIKNSIYLNIDWNEVWKRSLEANENMSGGKPNRIN